MSHCSLRSYTNTKKSLSLRLFFINSYLQNQYFSAMNTYYQPSGAFSPSSFIYFALIAFLIFPLVGFLYAYGIWYVPFPYLNIMFCGVFAVITGLLLDYGVIRPGKVRNTTLATVLGVLGGIIALYFHWAIWLDLAINVDDKIGVANIGIAVSSTKLGQVFLLLSHPVAMAKIMDLINDSGTWGISGGNVSGTILSIIWLVEAVLVIAVSAAFARSAAGKPYDESSNAWMHEAQLPISQYIDNPQEVLAHVMAGNYSDLTALQFGGNGVSLETNHSVLTLFHADNTDYFLSIENKIASIDSKGKISLEGTEFMQYLSISKATGDMLFSKILLA